MKSECSKFPEYNMMHDNPGPIIYWAITILRRQPSAWTPAPPPDPDRGRQEEAWVARQLIPRMIGQFHPGNSPQLISHHVVFVRGQKSKVKAWTNNTSPPTSICFQSHRHIDRHGRS